MAVTGNSSFDLGPQGLFAVHIAMHVIQGYLDILSAYWRVGCNELPVMVTLTESRVSQGKPSRADYPQLRTDRPQHPMSSGLMTLNNP